MAPVACGEVVIVPVEVFGSLVPGNEVGNCP